MGLPIAKFKLLISVLVDNDFSVVAFGETDENLFFADSVDEYVDIVTDLFLPVYELVDVVLSDMLKNEKIARFLPRRKI